MLNKTKFQLFSKGEVKPEGWLKRQLRIQADGLSGNLDKVWPDVRDSQWIGGDRDGWERVPYWLDGFVPLAYLLEDEDLIARAKRYIDGILERQSEDGWLCPCTIDERRSYDLWSGILIAKVMAMYADLSNDERIENAIYRFFENMWAFTRHTTIHNWASLRWFETLIPLYWLYERRKEDWILLLAKRLQEQGYDYERLFSPYRDQKPERTWTYSTHVVNLAMAIKQGALVSRMEGGDPEAFAHKMLKELFQHHGMAMGHFTGDECVMGDSPVQGTELCGVVEAMYSYEQLLEIAGDPVWGDYLERLAYNALPAAMSADMWTHQYDQQTNQIRCAKLPEDHVVFGTNSAESHLFGLEPNFGCCTANFNQGWPKFAMAAFMRSEEGIVSTVLAPASVRTMIGGRAVLCKLETEYPFRNTLTYTVTVDAPIEFELKLRIPGCAVAAVVDGNAATPGTFYSIKKVWSGTTVVKVAFDFETKLVERPREMKCLWRGPLLYSVAIQERWVMLEYTRADVERKFPYCDYELYPESDWNYGFTADPHFSVSEQPVSQYPFCGEKPPVEIEAELAPVDWPQEYGVAAVVPNSRKAQGEARAVRMIPYGCARLRMTEMPTVE
ncbi:MAG: glycoside hydrolase family 127 protein [Clostridia bacterium]